MPGQISAFTVAFESSPGEAFVIGIGGGSGSGKTTAASALVAQLGGPKFCTVINADNYFRSLSHIPVQDRKNHNFDDPASIESALLAQHIQALKQKQAIEMPMYDFTTSCRMTTTTTITPTPIIIVEGFLVLHFAALKPILDATLFVDTRADLALLRRIERDIRDRGVASAEDVINQYKTTIEPTYTRYILPCKKQAMMVLKNNDASTDLQFDMAPIIAELNTILHDRTAALCYRSKHTLQPLMTRAYGIMNTSQSPAPAAPITDLTLDQPQRNHPPKKVASKL